MHRRSSAWQVKRPLFVGGLIAVAVTAIALKASLAVTMGCVVPLVVLLYWKRLRLCAVIALCFLLVAVGYRHTYVLPAEKLDGQTDTIEGEVLEMPTYGRMYTVKITRSSYLPKGSRVMLRCPDEQTLNIGDRFTAEADLLAVKDNQTYYAARQAFACAFPRDGEGSMQVTSFSTQKVGVLQRIRTTLVNEPRTTLPRRESGLLAALCFGETGFVAEEDYDHFRGSGLNHLLVVSGLHLSMVAFAIRRLFHRLGRYPRSLLTLCTVWLFALFVGATPSILRAATMISVWLIGGLLFHQSDGLNSLGLAAIILLAINPYTLWNVGFQLSFAATLGVLVMMPRLMPRKQTSRDLPWWQQLWRWVRDGLLSVAAVSFSALLFTLPVSCYHYGGFPVTALPANLLAAPMAGASMLFGWLGSLCGLIPFLGWLSQGLFALAGLLIRYMAEVARLLSDKAWITMSQQWQWLLLVGICILLASGILWRVSRKRMAVVLLTLLLLATGIGIPFSTAPTRITVVPVDNEGGFILQQGKHCALIVTDARDINEIDYDTPAFEPDVLIALGGDASVLTQLSRWPQATVVVATPTDWAHGTTMPLTALPVGGKVTLWEGCRLVRLTDEWTLLHIGNETVCIGTNPKEPCPYPDGWHIYVGGAPATIPDHPYTIVCNDTWLRRHRNAVTGQATILYDQPITFTPQRGEWRRTLWL